MRPLQWRVFLSWQLEGVSCFKYGVRIEREARIAAIQAIRSISNWLYWHTPKAGESKPHGMDNEAGPIIAEKFSQGHVVVWHQSMPAIEHTSFKEKIATRSVKTQDCDKSHPKHTTLLVTPKMWTNDHLVHPPGRTVLFTILVTVMTPSPIIINVRRPIRTLRCVSWSPRVSYIGVSVNV